MPVHIAFVEVFASMAGGPRCHNIADFNLVIVTFIKAVRLKTGDERDN